MSILRCGMRFLLVVVVAGSATRAMAQGAGGAARRPPTLFGMERAPVGALVEPPPPGADGTFFYENNPNPNDASPYLAVVTFDAADETLGATLEPVSAAQRAQLDLPADRGLIVTTLSPEGPAAGAGLRVNDILLTLADKPLANPEDLTK